MGSKNKIISILAQFLGQGNTLTNSVILIDLCGGSHTASLMLSQLFYWHGRTKIPGGWIAKSDKEWHDELRLSPKQARWCRAKLIEYGFIETKTKRFNNKPTVHYRIIENRVLERIDALCPEGQNVSPSGAKQKCPGGQNRNALEGKTLTEPTTETTTKPTSFGYSDLLKSFGAEETVSLNRILGQYIKPDDWEKIKKHLPGFFERRTGNFRGSVDSYIRKQKWLSDPNPETAETKVYKSNATNIDSMFD